MPVRKNTKPVAKKTAAKKTTTPAKKSAASASTKKPTGNAAKFQEFADGLVAAIRDGSLDGALEAIDDALTDRVNAAQKTESTTAKKSASAKKTTAPPKRATKTVAAKVGETYKIAASFKKLAGAKVEFRRFKVVDGEANKDKAVVKMLTDKPGNPKGKVIVVPTSALS